MTVQTEAAPRVTPLCPLFGLCGGCATQDLPYEEELRLKEDALRRVLGVAADYEPIVASPLPYHYRSGLDVALVRTKTGGIAVGFMPEDRYHVLPVGSCAIAREEISSFLPALKDLAVARLPARYRTANLVVRTGGDGRVRWGGIGRHSLRLEPSDYLWAEVNGKRIHYSLDTFFQSNHSILPLVANRLAALVPPGAVFYDLYGGVGLFGILMAERASRVVIVENCVPSAELARYNVAWHGFKNVEVAEMTAETALSGRIGSEQDAPVFLFIDPPRRGLSEEAAAALGNATADALAYLSCNPESLARDVKRLEAAGWRLKRVMPFDFFPKTKHLETLAYFKKGEHR